MDLRPLLESLTREQRELLVGALEAKALLLDIGGSIYAASWYDVGWWVWELRPGSPEYFVQKDYSSCTCPAGGVCKHIVALKHGTATAPWDPPRPKRRKVRGPR